MHVNMRGVKTYVSNKLRGVIDLAKIMVLSETSQLGKYVLGTNLYCLASCIMKLYLLKVMESYKIIS